MKNLSSNYQTDSYPNQLYPVDIRKENLSLCLISRANFKMVFEETTLA